MGREGEERGTLQAKTDAGHTSVSTEAGHFPFHHVPGAPPSWLIKHNCNCEMPPLLTAARTGWQSLILPLACGSAQGQHLLGCRARVVPVAAVSVDPVPNASSPQALNLADLPLWTPL